MEVVNDLLMVADTANNPEFFFKTGEIYIYRISFNHETDEEMN